MISLKDTYLVPKIVFPLVLNKDQLRKILNVNQWDKSNEPFLYKLRLAAEIFFNRYIYYHLRDAIPYNKEIFFSACRYGNMEIIHLMIDKGVDYWNYGLGRACCGGHLSVVKLMIEKGANGWDTALCCACEGGSLPIVKLMIEKGADYLNLGLEEACKGGHLSVVQYLVEKIENKLSTLSPSLRDEIGTDNWNCGLYNACKGNHFLIVQIMIEKGANNLYRVFEMAKNRKYLEISNYLSKILKIQV